MNFDQRRLDVANAVLSRFTILQLSRSERGSMVVSWEMRGKQYSRRWQCRGQDFYPACSTAVAQLIRWVQGKPVLPLSTWRYWASETCKLLSHEAVDELWSGGYPAEAICVLCNQHIKGGLDWWSLKGVSGPCCSWQSGCRQKVDRDGKACK